MEGGAKAEGPPKVEKGGRENGTAKHSVGSGQDRERRDTLETGLRRMIVGQDEAIQQIVNIYQMHLTGNEPPRPADRELPVPGSDRFRQDPDRRGYRRGVTEESSAVIKIDCAEFQHSHEIAKLIGSPPGYLGHRETHPLLVAGSAEPVSHRDMKLSFVLFDEIEKASDALWNLLLGHPGQSDADARATTARWISRGP